MLNLAQTLRRPAIAFATLALLAFVLLASPSHAQGTPTYNAMTCVVSADLGTCGPIPATGGYSSIYIPSTGTTTQTLPAAGVPFYELDYPTPAPYSSPCGNVAYVCMERLSNLNTWATLGGSTSSNPCAGAINYLDPSTGMPGSAPFFNVASDSEVNIVGNTSGGGWTVLMGTTPGSNCEVLEDVSSSGAISNVRTAIALGVAGADAEMHASNSQVSRWIG